jgi:hypothetical protein
VLSIVARITVFVKTLTGDTISLTACSDSTIYDLKLQIQDQRGNPTHSQRLLYLGRELDDARLLSDFNMQNKTTIQLMEKISMPMLSVRKPIIYLFSPEPLDALVELSLVPQWNFSAIYPVVPIEQITTTQSGGQKVAWRVRVHPNGDLTELTTGLDTAFLFWEALCVFMIQ